MNPSDEDRAIPTATGIGLNPIDIAVVIAIGPIRLVDAVFDVNSVSSRVKTQKTAMKIISGGSHNIGDASAHPVRQACSIHQSTHR